MQHEKITPVRPFNSSMTIDAETAAQGGEDFWRKWQDTVSDAGETWVEASKAGSPAGALSAQMEFSVRNMQRWCGLAPAAPVDPAEPADVAAEPTVETAAPVADAALQAEEANDGVEVVDTVEAAAGPDDLKRIRGIGPAIERKLNGQGITTYSQIAGMSDSDVEALDAVLDFRGRIERDGWVTQAEQLAGRSEAL